jgi:hypothetical protein
MLKPGRLQEIAEQTLETNLQIVAIQEIRWKGRGKIKNGKYEIYYSCAEDNTGYAGTGFIVRKDIGGRVLGFEPYNERLCRLRIRGKFHNITITGAYAPTGDKDGALKEQFYEDLQKLQDKVPRKYVCNHAISNNLTIASTQFQCKGIDIVTWTGPDGQTVNRIDHVLVNKTKRGMIQDVRTMRGPKCDSHHFLQKIKVKRRLIISQMKKKEQTRWNSENLRNKQKRRQYRQLLHHKLQDKCNKI